MLILLIKLRREHYPIKCCLCFTKAKINKTDHYFREGPVSSKGLSFGRTLVRLTHLVTKDKKVYENEKIRYKL